MYNMYKSKIVEGEYIEITVECMQHGVHTLTDYNLSSSPS